MTKTLWFAAIAMTLTVACSKGQGKEDSHGGAAEGAHAAEHADHGEQGKKGEHGDEAEGEEQGEHGEHGEGEQVVLSTEQAASVKIALGTVERRADPGSIQATATIEPAADAQARVGSRIQGRVAALKAGVGDRVRKGQRLAVIDSPELGRAWADFIAALAGSNVARETAEREKALFEKRISAESEWRAAEAEAIKARAEKDAAENRLHALGITDAELPRASAGGHLGSTMSLVSPIDGVVVERDATLGQIVDPSHTLFVVMDLRRVWIVVEIYEQDLGRVREGARATVQVAAAPGREFSGNVENIGAVVDPKTRTAKVRIALDNPGMLKPGMFATVRLEVGASGQERKGLYAPAAAVQRMGEGRVVFVPRGNNVFEPREVKVARDAGDWVEIEDGLSAGEQVVTNGAFALKSELQKEEMGGGHAH